MKAHFSSRIAVWLLLVSGGAFTDSSTDVLAADDWSLELAEASRSGLPILILFTAQDCAYCARLKTGVLEPLLKRGELKGTAKIREIDIDRGGKIRDFDGEKVRTRVFVERYGVYATPTLMLMTSRGEPVGEPVVGFNNRDDYMPYLESFIKAIAATSQVAGSQAKPRPAQNAESS